MEADGLEDIEQSLPAEAADIWKAGQNFTLSSTPNSKSYAGASGNVYATGVAAKGAAMAATLSIGPPAAAPPGGNATSSDASALPNPKMCPRLLIQGAPAPPTARAHGARACAHTEPWSQVSCRCSSPSRHRPPLGSCASHLPAKPWPGAVT